jgi:hypothetical protein
MAFTWVRRNLIVANSCILAIAIVEDDVIVVVMYPSGLIRGHLMHYLLPAVLFGTLSG